jgi:hypothetical protein
MSNPVDISPLERTVVELAIAGDHPALAVLREQWATAVLVERSVTGAGLYATFKIGAGTRVLVMPQNRRRITIYDVLVEFPDIAPVGSLLYIDDGKLDVLELFTISGPWPKDLSRFSARYDREPRPLEALADVSPRTG